MTPEQIEIERKAFEAKFPHLDFSMEKDSWDRPQYKHRAVFDLWSGWLARAEQSQWRPIADVLPPAVGEEYLVCGPDGYGVDIQRWLGSEVGWVGLLFEVTHWMPLPAPPGDGKGG